MTESLFIMKQPIVKFKLDQPYKKSCQCFKSTGTVSLKPCASERPKAEA